MGWGGVGKTWLQPRWSWPLFPFPLHVGPRVPTLLFVMRKQRLFHREETRSPGQLARPWSALRTQLRLLIMEALEMSGKMDVRAAWEGGNLRGSLIFQHSPTHPLEPWAGLTDTVT